MLNFENGFGDRITPFEALGMITLICAQSGYRQWTIADVEKFIVPAIDAGQCKIYFGQDRSPVAFITWARVSDYYHSQLTNDGINPPFGEWNSGEHLWFMDIVSPPDLTLHVIRDMQRNHFPGDEAHSIKRNPDGSVKRIKSWRNRLAAQRSFASAND